MVAERLDLAVDQCLDLAALALHVAQPEVAVQHRWRKRVGDLCEQRFADPLVSSAQVLVDRGERAGPTLDLGGGVADQPSYRSQCGASDLRVEWVAGGGPRRGTGALRF